VLIIILYPDYQQFTTIIINISSFYYIQNISFTSLLINLNLIVLNFSMKMDIFDEKFIIGKIKAGDKTAFSYVFTSYYRDLVSFANTFIHNAEESHEIVQDVFVDLWTAHEQLLISKSLKSYLLKAVQNDCFDYIRHLAIKNKYSEFVLKNEELFENNTESYIIHSELEEQISNALKQMPSDLSVAFIMNRTNNLNYREIADKLNVSVRTVEVRISKAIQFMRIFLAAYLKFLFFVYYLFDK
jgi:RNA polymerase sigma-70 factor (family 1)